jgi:hypothetical protein
MTTLTFKYPGLSKVISGGQTGVDQGALVAAHKVGLATGGVAPKHYRTDRGYNPALMVFGLTEDDSGSYMSRTAKNVEAGNATLVLAVDPNSPGTRQTIALCGQIGRPFFLVSFDFSPKTPNLEEHVDSWVAHVVNFIKANRVSVLNVAGNRDELQSNAMFELTTVFLANVFQELDMDNLLLRDSEL